MKFKTMTPSKSLKSAKKIMKETEPPNLRNLFVKYIWDKQTGKITKTNNLTKWNKSLGADRSVAQTEFIHDNIYISTVFLGIASNLSGKPLLFENGIPQGKMPRAR